jgi:hypothetical protein
MVLVPRLSKRIAHSVQWRVIPYHFRNILGLSFLFRLLVFLRLKTKIGFSSQHHLDLSPASLCAPGTAAVGTTGRSSWYKDWKRLHVTGTVLFGTTVGPISFTSTTRLFSTTVENGIYVRKFGLIDDAKHHSTIGTVVEQTLGPF